MVGCCPRPHILEKYLAVLDNFDVRGRVSGSDLTHVLGGHAEADIDFPGHGQSILYMRHLAQGGQVVNEDSQVRVVSRTADILQDSPEDYASLRRVMPPSPASRIVATGPFPSPGSSNSLAPESGSA